VEGAADPADIRAWQRLSGRVTTSGKLSPDDLARLARIGVRRVINLALNDHPEALADEGARLAEHGVAYTHIPVPFDAPGEDHYAAFAQALAEEDGAVHVHCIMNWRVAAFFCRWHRAQRMPEGEARALMAAQWEPETSEHPAASAWARFIAGPAS
jgi:uncharacterized protein (TIGR01244 family)